MRVYGRGRGAGRTTRPCRRPSAGRPSARRASTTSCRPRPPSSPSSTLRSRGSGWSPSVTASVTISSSSSSGELDRAAGVPQRVGEQLAHQQLGQLGQRLASPRRRTARRPSRARRRPPRHAAVQPPGRDPAGVEPGAARPPAARRRRRGRRPGRGQSSRWSQSGSRPAGPAANASASASQAFVDVDVARLDQAVGVEQQPGAVGHLDAWSPRTARRRRPAERPRAAAAAGRCRPGSRSSGGGWPAVA